MYSGSPRELVQDTLLRLGSFLGLSGTFLSFLGFWVFGVLFLFLFFVFFVFFSTIIFIDNVHVFAVGAQAQSGTV